ncbi:MAG: hypothetical protein ABFD69_07660 [Candidatus Sumerlaeia bacterium]
MLDPSRPAILAAGVGPLPPERPERLHAPGVRLWGMARELARAGHRVRIAAAGFGQAAARTLTIFDLAPDRDNPVLSEPTRIELAAEVLPRTLNAQAAEIHAAATVSTTDVMNHALAASGLALPMWMDFFGDPMAEAQLLAVRGGSDEGLARQWSLVAPALARADRLSGCSRDQAAAIAGQLGAVGRLNRFTAFTPLVEVIRPWLEPIPMDIDAEPPVRGKLAPADAFIVVQTGGFNTWLDVESMFAALERAMAENPRIHFAATGGAIPGHYVGGFEWFSKQIESSPHRDRYHLLGWIPVGQVPRVILEADLGINLDLPCAEGRLGTRNRILDWLGAGVPTISTPGCELAEELGAAQLLDLVPHGDPAAAASAILSHAADPKPGKSQATDAADHLRRAYHPSICLRPLIDWAASPKPALDLQGYRAGNAAPSSLLGQAGDAEATYRAGMETARRLAQIEQKLASLEGSRWVRLALKLRGRKDPDQPPQS